MNKKNDSYSDLEMARRLSQHLSAISEQKIEENIEQEYAYASFEIEKPIIHDIGKLSKDRPVVASSNEEEPDEVYPISLADKYSDREEFWEEVVSWAGDVTNANLTFICQSGGMLVALNGDVIDVEPEKIGGRLLNMLDQAEKISDEHKELTSIIVKLEKFWITGIVLTTNDEPILLVLVTNNQIKENILLTVKKELSKSLDVNRY